MPSAPRILVIEASPALRTTLERTLRVRGGAVAGCAPEEAVETLSRFQPDLVLLAGDHWNDPIRRAVAKLARPAAVIAMVDDATAAPGEAAVALERPLTAGRLEAALARALRADARAVQSTG